MCGIRQTHIWSVGLISVLLLQGQSLPQELWKRLISILQFGHRKLKDSGRKRYRFETDDCSQKQMPAFLLPQASSITHTQIASPSSFWLFSWMGWLAVETSFPYFPGPTCLWHFSLDWNKTLNLWYKNHCYSYVWIENGMTCPHRKPEVNRSCKRNISVNTSIFKS